MDGVKVMLDAENLKISTYKLTKTTDNGIIYKRGEKLWNL